MQNHKGPGIGQAGPAQSESWAQWRDKHLPRLTPGAAAPSWAAATAFSSPGGCKVPPCKGRGLAPTFSCGAWGRWPMQSPRDFINHQIRWQVRWLLAGFASVLPTGACKTSSAEPGWEVKPEALPPREGTAWACPAAGARRWQTSTCIWRWTLSCEASSHSTSTLQKRNATAPVLFLSAPHRHHPLGIRVGERREGPLYRF